MKLNEHQAIVTPRVLLVPYSAHHVPTYHEWMKDEEIQKATASEPLTLPEEHAMQQSWRLDHDKLTFIVCHAPSTSPETSTVGEVKSGLDDAPDRMIGDVNLFLYEDEEEDDAKDAITPNKPIIGELEIMIAAVPARGRGLAHATLLAFLGYISANMALILAEYTAGSDEKSERYLKYLRVKIDQENGKSLGLFGRLGFQRTGGVNYFGEIEMRMQSTGDGGFTGLDVSRQETGKVVAYTL